MKKGQGLSMTTIVVAAIALLVLVILSVIFITRMGIFSKNLEKCPSGATCVDSGSCEPNGRVDTTYGCYVDGDMTDTMECCFPV